METVGAANYAPGRGQLGAVNEGASEEGQKEMADAAREWLRSNVIKFRS